MSVRSLKHTSVKSAQKTSSGVFSSTTPPTDPTAGALWFNTELGKTFVWYIDVDGGQWVEVGSDAAPAPLNDLDYFSDVALSSSTAGDALVYNGSEWTNQPRPGRNLVNNGAVQVHQRGTSATGITASGYYTIDRWRFFTTGVGTWTQTIENDAPTGSGLRKSVKVLCTTANAAPGADQEVTFYQQIEGQNLQHIKKGTVDANPVTLSFWVKSNVTGTYISELRDGNSSVRQVSAQYTISTSATWEKKVIVFPEDLLGEIANNTAGGILVNFFLSAGSNYTSGTLNTVWNLDVTANRAIGQTNLAANTNNYWQITGVQLEVGPVATSFEFKPYEQELAECQRYYFRVFPETTNRIISQGYNNSSTAHISVTEFPVTMRTRPGSLEQNGTASHYTIAHQATTTNCSSVPTYNVATTANAGVSTFSVASGLTAGQSARVLTNDATAYLAWSVDL